MASHRTRKERQRDLKDSSVTWSQTHNTFSFNSSGFDDHPPSLSRINRTIHDQTTSMRLRSGLFGGQAGRRSSSRVCFVICARLSCSRRYTPSHLLSDEITNVVLFNVCRLITHDRDTVSPMSLSDLFIVMRRRVILHQLREPQTSHRRVQRLLVNLQSFRSVLHRRRRL